MGKVAKITLLVLCLNLTVTKEVQATIVTDTIQAFTLHKNNLDPTIVYDGINGKIIAKIYPNQTEKTGHIFSVLECKNGWFRIDLNLTNVQAWVKVGVLGVNSKNYDQAFLILLEKANQNSKEVYKANFETTLILLDISKKWVRVELKNKNGKVYSGWIMKDMACGNPYTTCN